ncbi:unnamed protein product [Brugia timori]|uniref:DNA-directed DNA polymerase n=1 Tax=Brugia timori TaxID=42155 RepID=A0A0R3R667_9BILA|nr:unnamed protein product [Brugia timori]
MDGRYVMYVLGYIYYHKLSRVDELGYHLMSGDNFCYIFYKFLCDDVLGHIYNQELSRCARVGLRLLCNRKWNLNKTQQNLWGLHVDEKLEERWRSFGYDTVKLIERQALMQRKQFENLKQNLSNTQHALQVLF